MVDRIKPGTQAASIRAKRRSSTQEAIRKKAERGEATGDERAVVRVGKRNTKILTGQEDLSVWSDEELQRGQRKDKNGRWQGVKPTIVPKAIHDELVRRTLAKANQKLVENTETAVEALVDIVKGQDVEDKDRLRAIAMIMDRVMGKTPDKMELSGEVPPWQIAINAGIVRIKPSDILGDDEEDDDGEG